MSKWVRDNSSEFWDSPNSFHCKCLSCSCLSICKYCSWNYANTSTVVLQRQIFCEIKKNKKFLSTSIIHFMFIWINMFKLNNNFPSVSLISPTELLIIPDLILKLCFL
jgi:hypothetical protein